MINKIRKKLLTKTKHMKIEEYNAEARKALGKHFMDISTAILKSAMLLFTIVPITFFMKNVFDGNISKISFHEIIQSINSGGLAFIILEVCTLFIIIFGVYIRKIGLEHIHEAEEMNIQKT